MFGITQLNKQLGDIVKLTFNDTAEGFLFKNFGTNWPYFKRLLYGTFAKTNKALLHRAGVPLLNKEKLSQTTAALRSDVVGSYNPFIFMWKFLLSIVGMSKRNRIDTNLTTLKDYSTWNQSSRYVNQALKDILNLLHRRMGQLETFWSKLGLSSTKTIFNDNTVNGLKDTFKSWMQVFFNLANGGIPGQGISMTDVKFLQPLYKQVIYGKHAQYLKEDLGPAIAQALQEAQGVISKAHPSYTKAEGLTQNNTATFPQQNKNQAMRNLAQAPQPAYS